VQIVSTGQNRFAVAAGEWLSLRRCDMFIDLVILLIPHSVRSSKKERLGLYASRFYRSFLELRTEWDCLWGVVGYKHVTPRGETRR
jgi:hypothetical protein